MTFNASWEKNIYSQKKHISNYPYGDLVSIFFNSLRFLPQEKMKNKNDVKVLELGCGSGNNLWFLSELGFDTFGVDGSHSACEIAKELCTKRSTDPKIIQANFDALPFDDDTFDIIIDREATYCGTLENIKNWWREANRVLKSGGVVISFIFSDENQSLQKIKNKEIKAQYVENNTYKNIEAGAFKDTGIAHFTSYDEIFEIFSFTDIKFINKNISQTVYDNSDNQFNYAEWIIVGVKK